MLHAPASSRRSKIILFGVCAAVSLFAGAAADPAYAQAQTGSSTAWAVTLVLPPKLAAGAPATLATLGVDGKLAAHVAVELGNGERVESDATGRAFFTVPASGGFLIAHASGTSVAALVDSQVAASVPPVITVSPVVSSRDHFSICGGGFRGEAEADRVQINGELALVIAASPECLVVVPGPKAAPGAATISAKASTGRTEATTSLVSLDFEPPNPPLTPGNKGWLILRARGSDLRLRVVVENESPGVIHFEKGDAQELTTSGSENNTAEIRVEAVRSGDFSFRARLAPTPDPETARRFLEAAWPLAPQNLQGILKKMAANLARHPRDWAKVQSQLQQIVSVTMAGDFRTLLEAAQSAL
ncbi:MAG TPA: hypothetical protein VJW93_06500 [Candidatus Acidoferrales bacterium]|nr:hypothetical protein [Candidatus Acidoferrales bacterium]